MAGRSAVCDCGREFRTGAIADHGLCPACLALEDRIYEVRPSLPGEYDMQPWPWSRAAMRERLGIIGDVDE